MSTVKEAEEKADQNIEWSDGDNTSAVNLQPQNYSGACPEKSVNGYMSEEDLKVGIPQNRGEPDVDGTHAKSSKLKSTLKRTLPSTFHDAKRRPDNPVEENAMNVIDGSLDIPPSQHPVPFKKPKLEPSQRETMKEKNAESETAARTYRWMNRKDKEIRRSLGQEHPLRRSLMGTTSTDSSTSTSRSEEGAPPAPTATDEQQALIPLPAASVSINIAGLQSSAESNDAGHGNQLAEGRGQVVVNGFAPPSKHCDFSFEGWLNKIHSIQGVSVLPANHESKKRNLESLVNNLARKKAASDFKTALETSPPHTQGNARSEPRLRNTRKQKRPTAISLEVLDSTLVVLDNGSLAAEEQDILVKISTSSSKKSRSSSENEDETWSPGMKKLKRKRREHGSGYDAHRREQNRLATQRFRQRKKEAEKNEQEKSRLVTRNAFLRLESFRLESEMEELRGTLQILKNFGST